MCCAGQDLHSAVCGPTVTAIANYTMRVAQTSLDDQQRQDALKFLGERYIRSCDEAAVTHRRVDVAT